MHLKKSTLYALHAALELTLAAGHPVTAAQVAARYGSPEHVVAKVLAQLVRVGLATASPGVGGGYRLARDASEVTVRDVIEVFEPLESRSTPSSDEREDALARDAALARLHDLFAEVDETARTTFASVTLATLGGSERWRARNA